MKIKIAVYNDPVVNTLFSNFDAEESVDIFKTDEKTALELLVNSKVDCAMLNPLTYSQATGKSDLRILPAPMIISHGYSKLMSLFFNNNLHEFGTCGIPAGESYLTTIFKTLLHERYEMSPRFIADSGTPADLLTKYDAAIIKGYDPDNEKSMDIGEDWQQTYEIPLIAAFWAVRNEEEPQNIQEIITKISGSGSVTTVVNASGKNEYEREGKITRSWDDETADAMTHVLHLLYYKQIIDNIPEIKIFGMEPEL